MPIRNLLMLQQQGYELGRIRTGTSVAVPGKTWRRPVRLETYRFTTRDLELTTAVAELYGGTARPWEGHAGQFEVTTQRDAIEVYVPPRTLTVDTDMVLYKGGICERRCDGITERKSGKPCLCPQPEDPDDEASVRRALDKRLRLAALNPAEACTQQTQINVAIPDLPGLGKWRLVTGSYYVAVETGDTAALMDGARHSGTYLRAVMRIEERLRGDGKPFPVVALRIGATLRQIASGELPAGPAGLMAMLAPAGEARPALTAGGARVPALPAGNGAGLASAPPARTAVVPLPPEVGRAAPAEPAAPENPADGSSEMSPAQEIAAAVAGASRVQLSARRKQAETLDCLDDIVNTSLPGEPEVHETLGALLDALDQARAAG
jgi:Recombination directionality factor-like